MVTLWIVPSEQDSRRLKSIIYSGSRANANCRSKASYPIFEPHITLASLPKDIELQLPTIRTAIPELNNLNIQFDSIKVGNAYFRSVYIAVKLSAELTMLHQHVHAALGVDPRTPSFPHISLCYIDDDDESEREKLRENLEKDHKLRTNTDGLTELNCSEDPEVEDWISGFRAAEIWITNCVGPVEEWSVIEKIPLNT